MVFGFSGRYNKSSGACLGYVVSDGATLHSDDEGENADTFAAGVQVTGIVDSLFV